MNKVINYDTEVTEFEPLSEMVGKERMEHIIILNGASNQKMSNDINYQFHQNSNFNYLTGFQEADSILILETIPNKPHPQFKSVLFVQPYEGPQSEIWTGFRAGVDDAKDLTGIDEVHDINSLTEYLDKNYIGKKCRIWGNFMPGQITNFDLHSKYLHRFVSSAIKSGVEIFPLKNFLTENRVVKSDSEVEAIRKDWI